MGLQGINIEFETEQPKLEGRIHLIDIKIWV